STTGIFSVGRVGRYIPFSKNSRDPWETGCNIFFAIIPLGRTERCPFPRPWPVRRPGSKGGFGRCTISSLRKSPKFEIVHFLNWPWTWGLMACGSKGIFIALIYWKGSFQSISLGRVQEWIMQGPYLSMAIALLTLGRPNTLPTPVIKALGNIHGPEMDMEIVKYVKSNI